MFKTGVSYMIHVQYKKWYKFWNTTFINKFKNDFIMIAINVSV